MKQLILSLTLLTVLLSAPAKSALADKFPEAKAMLPFIERFPTLAKLL